MLRDSKDRQWIDSSIGLFRLIDIRGSQIQLHAVSGRLGAAGRPFGANLLEDARGRIWTHRRIHDPDKDRIQELTVADGIGHGRFRSYAQSPCGELPFGDSEGLALVNPARFTTWKHQSPVAVIELRIDGVERAYTPAAAISLAAHERGFAVEFAALDYSAPQPMRYAYRLDGYDDNGRQTGAQQRIAAYANLWPGEYTLHVRGSNRNGAFSSNELRVPVRILPAYWHALLVALAVVALG